MLLLIRMMNLPSQHHKSWIACDGGLSKNYLVAGQRGLFAMPCPIAFSIKCPLGRLLEPPIGPHRYHS